MIDHGPIQLLAIGFGPDADYQGAILDELERLDGKGLIRVLDLLFVASDEETDELVALDYQVDDLGGLVGALLDFGFEGEQVRRRDTISEAPGTNAWMSTRSHLEDLVRATPPDVAIGFLLIEHLWARDLKQAIRSAGGAALAEEFLSDQALEVIGAERAATVAILDQIEREEAAGGGL
jgi:hypothetical protein